MSALEETTTESLDIVVRTSSSRKLELLIRSRFDELAHYLKSFKNADSNQVHGVFDGVLEGTKGLAEIFDACNRNGREVSVVDYQALFFAEYGTFDGAGCMPAENVFGEVCRQMKTVSDKDREILAL